MLVCGYLLLTHALLVGGFGRGFRLVARWGCIGMDKRESSGEGVMEYAENGRHASWP
jgi:hypothetical protein